MTSTPREIATLWREQMRKGYLKLLTLFTLTKEPLHGYQIIKRIKEYTLGVIAPTAGALYPTLKELEGKGLIKGEWRPEERKKVYRITERGREAFKEAAERHFELTHSIRSWLVKTLVDLKILDEVKPSPPALAPVLKLLLLKEDTSTEEKIRALEVLRSQLRRAANALNKMADRVENRIEELKSGGSDQPAKTC